eukprot:m.70237 g.70237  ORF g.70237 m.70237 type:complete len:668 (+) comp11664_c0_seq1:84-2087(+)
MSEVEKKEFDMIDLAVVGVALVVVVWFVLKKFVWGKGSSKSSSGKSVSRFAVVSPDADDGDGSFVSKMKKMDAHVVIFYGSQTGTAEDFSMRLAHDGRRYGINCLVEDIQDYDMEQLKELKEIENAVVIFCVSTYGEGEPTDNAQEFYQFLLNLEENGEEFDLANTNFTVFGLGNKTYDHYNAMGIFVDKMMEKLGATRLVELGLGDDDANMEEDFVNWKDNVWPAICDLLCVDPTDSGVSFRQFELKPDKIGKKVFTGEPAFFGSFEMQKRPFSQKNPFAAKVATRRELYDDDERSCLHVELDIAGSSLKYAAGDHVAIFPKNNPDIVERLGKRLKCDLDEVIYLHTTDQFSRKKTPFPCPCSYRTALTHYVDICSVPGLNVFQELIQYAEDEDEKKRLTFLVSKEGRKEFAEYAHNSIRTIVQVLQDFSSVSIPADHLLELLPRLQPRYYSISSSSRMHPDKIHITAAVVRYTAPAGHEMEGVATTYLERVNLINEKIPIFLRRSTFRLPKPSVPVIMIGPGTGLAPFRGFLQDRQALRSQGKDTGAMVLFFGCQHEKQHYMYREELEGFMREGTLTHLYTAFSRDGPKKVYVQHLMEDHEAEIGELIRMGAHIYVCGDAKHMARDVHRCIVNIIKTTFSCSTTDAEDRLAQMALRRKFQQDVWS